MTLKLAYSTNAYTRYRLEDALEHIAALGYQGVEILCDRPHWFPGEVKAADVKAVHDQLQALGLEVSNLNANTANGYYQPLPAENLFEPALSNPDPVARNWRIDYTREALRLAAELDAPCVSITSGRPNPGTDPAEQLDWFCHSLAILCRSAREYGVRLGIEYEPGLLVERAGEVLDVLDQVGDDYLGVNLDLGHAYLAGEPPDRCIAPLVNRIWNVHVEDIRGGKHFHLPPGEGEMPLSDYLELLGKLDYQGFLTVELYTYPQCPDEVGKRAITHLQRLLSGPAPA